MTPPPNQNHANGFRLSDFHYDLPAELIAQAPLAGRSDSRLMVVDGCLPSTEPVVHKLMTDLPQLLRAGDHLVFNNTRVIPARLFGAKVSGGKLEMMLERITPTGSVLARIRCSKSPRVDSIIQLWVAQGSEDESFQACIVARHDDLFELAAASGDNEALALFIERHGQIPLPPYISRVPDASDQDRYQTVFGEEPGAVAAPTAGLHFDDALFAVLASAGITHSFITLHVGSGTFQPVRVDNPADHVMHAERVHVEQDTVAAISEARKRGGRVIAVGTTCVRSLEAAALEGGGTLQPFSGETRLFLTPGACFNVIDGMITNFHLPESTLLMLVSAFAGRENMMAAYKQAIAERYRFFSYGDVMLLWPQPGVSQSRAGQ